MGGETRARNDTFRDCTPVMLQVLKADEKGEWREKQKGLNKLGELLRLKGFQKWALKEH